MKKITIIVMLAGFLTAFTTLKRVDNIVENVKELYGYTLKEKDFDPSDFNLWVITHSVAFDKTFIAETEKAARPDFNAELVIAGKVETLNYTYRLKFKTILTKGDEMNVYFSVRKAGPANHGNGPLSLATLQKNQGIKKINFYHDNILVRTVPIVWVY
ncbi:hypothetical protein CAP36_04225 [Chitinophagaceae bacterium IBVUCB2]|nr:hypothetical protein CAP36_04225 [Chitinophagaceae bacterium IBVUCB2]